MTNRSMKPFALIFGSSALMVLFATAARADGFVCRGIDQPLTVRAYHHVQPEAGTRNAAVLIVSDDRLQRGNRTIAKFTDVKNKLTRRTGEMTYIGQVDLRVSESNRRGEYVGGTRLGELKTLVLTVDHNFGQISTRGALVRGWLTLNFRDTNRIDTVLDMECERYLKH